MSNVIIGIIGVILFIGLAVAGAVILGDDFINAKSSAKAATYVTQLQQYQIAIQTLETRRGIRPPASSYNTIGDILVTYDALKSKPTNFVNPSQGFRALDRNGQITANPTAVVIGALDNTENSKKICFAIEETVGNPDPTAAVTNASTFVAKFTSSPRVGCYKDTVGNYITYIPV